MERKDTLTLTCIPSQHDQANHCWAACAQAATPQPRATVEDEQLTSSPASLRRCSTTAHTVAKVALPSVPPHTSPHQLTHLPRSSAVRPHVAASGRRRCLKMWRAGVGAGLALLRPEVPAVG